MSSNNTSPLVTESNVLTVCDNRTCSTAKCALCLHCSQQYCFVHFLKHNEELSVNAYNFTLAIDQLEDQIKNLKLDESLRRTIHSLDQWRKNLIRTIEYVYQEKLSSIKSNYIQLSNYLQQFQFEQSSHIQTLRIDLEQMKFIRNTYDEEMNKIQTTIKQLQKNMSELQYDLEMKECQIPNIYDSIKCEILWKRHRTDDIQSPKILDENDEDYSTSYENSILSFLTGNDSETTKDEKIKKTLLTDKKLTILNSNNNKKRRNCANCGKCYHPSSLQRHYRQCKQLNSNLDESTLKTVTNMINPSQNSVNS